MTHQPEESYSPLEHLARSAFGVDWLDTHVAMYTAYFDRSGSPDRHRVTVVAGFVSTVRRWEEFAVQWRDVLAAYNIPHFHMREFTQSVGAFAGWQGHEERRRSLVGALVDVIASTLDRQAEISAFAIPHAVFDEVNREWELAETYKNAFVFAAREVAYNAELMLVGLGEPVRRQADRIRYVFDRGEEGKGAVVDLFDADGLSTPTFEPSRDDPKTGLPGMVQLQAADFAAYEYFRLFEDLPKMTWPFKTRVSGDMVRGAISGLFNEYSKSMIERRCVQRGIKRRTA